MPDRGIKPTLVNGAAHPPRVCQAWHRTSEVEVLVPGMRGAEGSLKRKGVTVRWGLKEAWNDRAGRGTRTGYEV
jgi:hypothetical protein